MILFCIANLLFLMDIFGSPVDRASYGYLYSNIHSTSHVAAESHDSQPQQNIHRRLGLFTKKFYVNTFVHS